MEKSKVNKRTQYLFYLYMLWVFLFVIIKIDDGLQNLNFLNIFNFGQPLRINLVPFQTIQGDIWNLRNGLANYAIPNLVGNTLLFIPFGIFIRYLYQTSFIKTLLYCFLISLFFETFQLISNLGSFDIDDILLNVSSSVVGYLLCRIFQLIYHKSEEHPL